MSSTTTTTTTKRARTRKPRPPKAAASTTTTTVVRRRPPRRPKRAGPRPAASAGDFYSAHLQLRKNIHLQDLLCASNKGAGFGDNPVMLRGQRMDKLGTRTLVSFPASRHVQFVATNNPQYPFLWRDLDNDPEDTATPSITWTAALLPPSPDTVDMRSQRFLPLGANSCSIVPDAGGFCNIELSMPLIAGTGVGGGSVPVLFPTLRGGRQLYRVQADHSSTDLLLYVETPAFGNMQCRPHIGWYDANLVQIATSTLVYASCNSNVSYAVTPPVGVRFMYLELQFKDIPASTYATRINAFLTNTPAPFLVSSDVSIVSRGSEFRDGVGGLCAGASAQLTGQTWWLKNVTNKFSKSGAIVAASGLNNVFPSLFLNATELASFQQDYKRLAAESGIVGLSTPSDASLYEQSFDVSSNFTSWTTVRGECVSPDPQTYSLQTDVQMRGVITNVLLRKNPYGLGSSMSIAGFWDALSAIPRFTSNDGHVPFYEKVFDAIRRASRTAVSVSEDAIDVADNLFSIVHTTNAHKRNQRAMDAVDNELYGRQ